MRIAIDVDPQNGQSNVNTQSLWRHGTDGNETLNNKQRRTRNRAGARQVSREHL